jgi:hypothetical protein
MTTYREFIESQNVLLEAKKKREVETFCYMLYLDKESDKAIKDIIKTMDVDGTKVGDYHCTVRYFEPIEGKATGAKGLIDYLDSFGNLPIIEAFPKQLSVFGKDKNYLVFELVSLRLQDWFNRVNFEMTMKNYPSSEFPVYKPHVSLFKKADLSAGMPKFDIAAHRIPLVFDRHVITDHNEKVIWEKTGIRRTK